MSNLIYKKMTDVMKDIGSISKDQTNDAQRFKFRGIDQFVNALYPALTRNSVFMTTDILKEEHEIKEVVRSTGKVGYDKHVSLQMKYTFYAEDGSSVSSTVPSEGLDSGDKATNKALSAALKYALIQTFSIPTADMEEADKDSPTISSRPAEKVFIPATSGSVNSQPVLKEVVTAPTGVNAEPTAQKTRTTFRKSSTPAQPVQTTAATVTTVTTGGFSL